MQTEQPENSLLINFNEKQYDWNIETLEDFIPLLEKAIKDYNSLGIGEFLEKDFRSLFLAPKDFLKHAMMKDKPLEVGGMKVSKEKLWELLEKPPFYFSLIADIESIIERIKKVRRLGSSLPNDFYDDPGYFLDLFAFNKDGNIILPKKIKNEIKLQNETWISNNDTIELYLLLKSLTEIFNKSNLILGAVQTNIFGNLDSFLREYLKFDPTAKKHEIRIDVIKNRDLGNGHIVKPQFPRKIK